MTYVSTLSPKYLLLILCVLRGVDTYVIIDVEQLSSNKSKHIHNMNIKELENKAREVCPKWLQDEVDEMLGNIKLERESDPDSWGDDWNFFEVLDFFEGSDWGREHRYKLALTKINRHIGVYRQLGKGEEVMSWSSTGTKWFREGDWYFDKQWHDLLTK